MRSVVSYNEKGFSCRWRWLFLFIFGSLLVRASNSLMNRVWVRNYKNCGVVWWRRGCGNTAWRRREAPLKIRNAWREGRKKAVAVAFLVASAPIRSAARRRSRFRGRLRLFLLLPFATKIIVLVVYSCCRPPPPLADALRHSIAYRGHVNAVAATTRELVCKCNTRDLLMRWWPPPRSPHTPYSTGHLLFVPHLQFVTSFAF